MAILMVLVFLSLVSCAGAHEHLFKDIQNRQVTKQEVQSKLGPPMQIQQSQDMEIWIYSGSYGLSPCFYYYYFNRQGICTYYRRELDRATAATLLR